MPTPLSALERPPARRRYRQSSTCRPTPVAAAHGRTRVRPGNVGKDHRGCYRRAAELKLPQSPPEPAPVPAVDASSAVPDQAPRSPPDHEPLKCRTGRAPVAAAGRGAAHHRRHRSSRRCRRSSHRCRRFHCRRRHSLPQHSRRLRGNHSSGCAQSTDDACCCASRLKGKIPGPDAGLGHTATRSLKARRCAGTAQP